MLRMRVASVPLVAACLGCALPARDNPRDPSIAPVASLAVIDRGWPDATGFCAVVTGSAAFPSIVSSSRGRCLALDARASLSPRGDTLALGFEIVDPASGIVLAVPLAQASGNDRVAPLEKFLRSFPTGRDLRARVRVTDVALGTTVVTEAAFVAENSPPVLVVDRPRTFPLGGNPWAPGAAFTGVAFGIAGSFDPDRDPLHVCWTFPGESETCASAAAPGAPSDSVVVVRDIPSVVRGQFVGTAILHDGAPGTPFASISRPERSTVRVREPDPWLHYGAYLGNVTQQAGHLARLDGTRSSFPNARTAGNARASAIGTFVDGATPVIVERDTTLVRSVAWPSGMVLSSTMLLDTERAYAVASGADRRVWFVAPGPKPLRTFQVDAGGLLQAEATLTQTPTPTPTPGPPAGGTVATVDDSGNAWAAEENSDTYRVLRVNAATIAYDDYVLGAGRRIRNIAARPGTAEVWILDEAVGVPPVLRRFSAPGVEEAAWTLDGTEDAQGLAWAGSDSLWLGHGDLGLIRVDALLLDRFGEQTTVEASTIDAFPLFAISGMVADGATGTVWVDSGAVGGSWRADTAGHLDLVGPSARFFAVDANGSALFAFDPDGVSGSQLESVSRGAVVGGADRPLTYEVGLSGGADSATGGAWLYRPDPGDVILVDADGEIQKRRSRIDFGGGPESVPLLASFRPSPDGSRAWAIEALDVDFNTRGRVLVLDLRSDPMPAREVLDATEAVEIYGAPRFPVLEPSSPDGSWAWTIRFVGGGAATAMMLQTNGTFVPVPGGVGDIPERAQGSLIARAARSARTNSLCIAAWDTLSGGNLRVRRIDPAGGSEIFVNNEISLTPASNGGLLQAAASSDGSTDLCWVGWRNEALQAEVRAFGNPGPVAEKIALRSFSAPGTAELISILPVGGSALWMVVAESPDGGFDFDYRLRRFGFDTNPTPASEIDLGSVGEGFFPQTNGPSAGFLSSEAPIQRGGY